MAEIADAAFQYQTALEKGDKRIVGVNVHTDSVTGDLEILRVSHEVEIEQVPSCSAPAAAPRPGRVDAALAELVGPPRSDGEH